jgi:GTP-binding protein
MHFRAEPGAPGLGSNMTGGAGGDMHVRVPPGTIFRRRDAAPGERPVAEVVEPGERALLVAGGRGGRGNASFKSGRNK